MRPATQFHAFTSKYSGRVLRLVTPIEVSAAFDPKAPPSPLPSRIKVNALWDTGATGSVLTARTAASLKLVPTGSVIVNHAGGTSTQNTYVVNIVLPNKVGAVGVVVSECSDVVGGFEAIVGMDIITQGDLSITNVSGQTCMSFRTPSIQVVDYVDEASKLRFAGVGRNDPCPCGKKGPDGRRLKFKRCCGKSSV